VEIPAIYAGYDKHARDERAIGLLTRLGLADRAAHRPNQLSGGQQQRVSIARALMNGGEIILADEPSGALDQASGREVLKILRELHELGHTIIIVTHDPEIAAQANRIVEITDGRIVRDSSQLEVRNPDFASNGDGNYVASQNETGDARFPLPNPPQKGEGANESLRELQLNERPLAAPHDRSRATLTQLFEALKMALHAMLVNRMRSALTMLGIVIGITSVVSIVALSQGAEASMLKSLRDAAGNVFSVYRGESWNFEQSGEIQTMMPADMEAIEELPDIENVKPIVDTSVRVRHHNTDAMADISGASIDSSRSFGLPIIMGRDFNEDDIRARAQVVVIDYRMQEQLFDQGENPLGQMVLLGNIPCVVIGVTGKATGVLALDIDPRLHGSIPYTTASSHLLGRLYLDGMSVKVREGWPMTDAQNHVEKLLLQRHGKKDFKIFNEDTLVQNFNKIVQVATLVLGLVGAISLAVGGVGVMNIMLVSVTERTREIGIRMAVGARQRDVQNQFLIEAVTLCLVGGLIGVALTVLIGVVASMATDLFKMEVSLTSIIAAFVISTALGVLFGFWPARNASRLDPIDALARD